MPNERVATDQTDKNYEAEEFLNELARELVARDLKQRVLADAEQSSATQSQVSHVDNPRGISTKNQRPADAVWEQSTSG